MLCHSLRRIAGAPFSIRLLLLIAPLALAGCKTFSPDGGMNNVASIAGTALAKDIAVVRSPDDDIQARQKMKALLNGALTADRSVQIALLNNRGLQAAYNELGLSETQMIAASLPPNPTISVSRLASSPEIEIEGKIVASLLSLAMLPARSEIAANRFRQAQLRAAQETLRVAGEARSAFFHSVAARQRVAVLNRAKAAAEGMANVARRLGETGALNKLDQAREQAFYAETTAQLASARIAAASEREKLIRALGLWGDDLTFKLPIELPAMPRIRALPETEREAVARRVDLQIARLEVEALAKTYGLIGATRFVNLLDVSGLTKDTKDRLSGDHVRARGFELEVQIPIFDGGELRMRQAEQTYAQAVNLLIEKAINVRSQAREAYMAYRGTYDIATHYRREVLPLRKIISDEMLLRYNAMQIDTFVLLADARQKTASQLAAIDAQQAFWLAETNLLAAVIGGTRSDVSAPQVSVGTEPSGGGH